jgi:hypothetical protein
MEKQKISKKLYVAGNEYDFALLMRSYNMQIPGFRKGAFNRSILDVHVGTQAREYIKYMKLKELFDLYTDVSNAKAKMYANNDSSKREAIFIIEVEFQGVEKPQEAKAESEAVGQVAETSSAE